MGQRLKLQLVVGIFSFCWMFYLLMPCLNQGWDFFFLSDLFESEPANFIFLMLFFLAVAVVSVDAAELCYKYSRRLRWFKPKLGELLVKQGFITQKELDAALDEQNLRTGEILLRYGRISPAELQIALDHQKAQPGEKMGAVLVELGFVTSRDIQWVLEKVNRKLGRILIERGLINEDDLRRVLGKGWYGRYMGS